MDRAILAIDQGTTSSRAIIFTGGGDVVNTAQKEIALIYPQKGWVEQDAEDIWDHTCKVCQDVLRSTGLSGDDIGTIGITNQRETTILWNRHTGEPVYNAIVWQDRRTAAMCEKLRKDGYEDAIQEKTGLLLDPYFSATKISWILDNVPGVRRKAEKGDIAFGTVDSYLLWKLTDGKVHATDVTNASRTMLFDINEFCWDEELLRLFDIPSSLMPEIKDNVSEFGETDINLFGSPIPIHGMAGDQQAALFGQTCFDEGMVKSTYGTGCFLLMNIGNKAKISENRLLTSPAYRIDGTANYAIEGAIFVAGAAIQWLRDQLGIIADAAESEDLAYSVDDNGGVTFVPAFTGLGAPWWVPEATAAILGLTRENNKAHIVRAALEAQAYQTLDLMDAIKGDTGFDPDIIRVDGGLVKNNFMCQFLADMLDTTVELPMNTETTAQGAAYLAGLGAGIYKDLGDIQRHWERDKRYKSKMDESERSKLYMNWTNSVRRILMQP